MLQAQLLLLLRPLVQLEQDPQLPLQPQPLAQLPPQLLLHLQEAQVHISLMLAR